MLKKFYFVLGLVLSLGLNAQTGIRKNIKKEITPVNRVNVFLGSSGDHGQLSPAASFPFSMLSIGPQTYPSTHTGYEHLAKQFFGFTHNRFEGVGCMGSGGNILVKPFLGTVHQTTQLDKKEEYAEPGYYSVSFQNRIKAEFTVLEQSGHHRYFFPEGQKGLFVDLSHSIVNRFVAEEHEVKGNSVSGWIEAQTTCSAGKYRIYYFLELSTPVQWKELGKHQLVAQVEGNRSVLDVKIALSSVSAEYARQSITSGSFESVRKKSSDEWNKLLSQIQVEGDKERMDLFYSLLYRTIQSPYVISEKDGTYRAIDGSVQFSKDKIFNGWAIWDNYRTQLPLLSFAYPHQYKNMVQSIANLYPYGKKPFATMHEPSPTVRTEHAVVVLLDAYRKGVPIDFKAIRDSLITEIDHLDYSTPDKALESCYDAWALSQIFEILNEKELSEKYRKKALTYKQYWNKDFKNIDKSDVDRIGARGLYQGTIWQYRWAVPFDVKGLIELIGGEEKYVQQLDEFFKGDYYNHSNEPDIQVPLMYNASQKPWKSQALVHKIAVDTIVQHYFNDNSRGIGSFIDRVYKNDPKAYIRTMDDDAGALSGWFVMASCGLFPACVGWPAYYLNVPLFKTTELKWPNGKSFSIHVNYYAEKNVYIQSITLNGKKLERNWLTHDEIMKGGQLVITASDQPNLNWGLKNQWISELKTTE
jgi:putative alpha-1,2-mannosidase